MTWPQLIRSTVLAAALAMLAIAMALPSPAAGVACGSSGDIICDSYCSKICEDEEGEYCCAWGVRVRVSPD